MDNRSLIVFISKLMIGSGIEDRDMPRPFVVKFHKADSRYRFFLVVVKETAMEIKELSKIKKYSK